MNNKGFTLIELLSVIAVLAIIAGIATPNVLSSINASKNNQYISFAEDLLNKGKYYYSLKDKYINKFDNEEDCISISAKNLGFENVVDPENGYYKLDESKIKICIENSTIKYYVKIYGEKKGIYNNNTTNKYISEADLKTSIATIY